jgi:hypothetical protein
MFQVLGSSLVVAESGIFQRAGLCGYAAQPPVRAWWA